MVIQFKIRARESNRLSGLFQPFQAARTEPGWDYLSSRAVVRSYGGDLRFEPNLGRSCFVVKLQKV